MKKFLCFVLTLLVLASLCAPFCAADGPENAEQIRQKILEVMERWPDGSYFTNDGGPCTRHSDSSSFSCSNCRRVTAEEAGTEGNMQCFGFGRVVFWQVFGLAYPHYSSSSNWKPSGSEMKNVVQVWWGTPGTRLDEEGIRQAFSFASIGDVVHTGLPHTMVFLQCESDGIAVYDANYDMYTCEVLVHVIPWEDLIRWTRRYGMSIYRAANYPELSGYSIVPVPGRDVGKLTVEASPFDGVDLDTSVDDFSGLKLSYKKGAEEYVLTCTGGTTFEISGADGIRTVDANGGSELSPSIGVTPGSAPEPGRIRIGFLDSVAVIDRDIAEAYEPAIMSFSYPDLLEYTEGEEFSYSGASVTVRLSDGATVVFTEKEIEYTEFDLSVPGEYRVFMEVMGMQTPPFVVTVREAPPSSAAPVTALITEAQSVPASSSQLSDRTSSRRFAFIALGLVICAAGVGVFRIGGRVKKGGRG
ncbi:MAG: bacterial Ig-like domain-containing protein [Clostridia bacterium]|nr:bacterial Ig-like domain-containing protein [Clostridia bacterium]